MMRPIGMHLRPVGIACYDIGPWFLIINGFLIILSGDYIYVISVDFRPTLFLL